MLPPVRVNPAFTREEGFNDMGVQKFHAIGFEFPLEATFGPKPKNIFSIWLHRFLARRRLRLLQPKDPLNIGVTNREAVNEAKKPFWVA